MDANNTLQTVATTVAGLAPEILAAGGKAVNPNVATIVALAPIALQFLQSATQLQQAGAMSAEALAGLFATIGQGIQSNHDKWVAMNAVDATKKTMPSILTNQAG